MSNGNYPLSSSVLSELDRLGIAHSPWEDISAKEKPFSFYGAEHGSWKGSDPGGDLKEISTAKRCIFKNVSWKLFDVYENGNTFLHFMKGSSENNDVMDGTKRRLLVPFALSADQFYYAVDLLQDEADHADNPSVFKLDHDGTGVTFVNSKLSDFLRTFKRSMKSASDVGL